MKNRTRLTWCLLCVASLGLLHCGESDAPQHMPGDEVDMMRVDQGAGAPDLGASSPDMATDTPDQGDPALDMNPSPDMPADMRPRCVDADCPGAPNAAGVCAEDDFCSTECLIGFADCDANADGCETSTQDNLEHCGGCGVACEGAEHATATCDGGACGLVCEDGFADCDMEPGCESDLSSPQSCGACGVTCDAPPNSVAACGDDGMCVYTCSPGFEDCDDTVPGCETELATDADHCGACGNACDGGPNTSSSCVASACVSSCDAGWADCISESMNGRVPLDPAGCETQLGTVNNCAACGDVCSAPANATASCDMQGQCQSECKPGFADCGGDAACEIDTDNDMNNCGGCGVVCPGAVNATATCSAGVCGFACDAGYEDCDAAPGCEVETTQDVNNCGSCGVTCVAEQNEVAACMMSACETSCQQDFGDCDAGVAGCETNLAQDVNNCGGCGLGCVSPAHATATCANSSCGYTCDANRQDCNGSIADGCEVDTSSDPMNCGGCNTACLRGAPYCQQGTCVPIKRAFLTSVHVKPGELGGLAGADSHCQQSAIAAGLPGVYMAWLSDGTGSPSTRFTRSNGPYMRTDGVKVADNWADLTDGSLDAAINITEYGVPGVKVEGHESQAAFWATTNTLTSGAAYVTFSNQTCNNFSNTASYVATANPAANDVYWTLGWTGGKCSRLFALYCFQQ